MWNVQALSLPVVIPALGLVALLTSGFSVVERTASVVGQLKKLSVEELMDTEVTSVSRSPEKLLDTASAIQVISGEEIHRSTADTLADALRLADNLQVAQKDPHDWAISARGFNSNLGDKLLVLMDGRTVYTPLFSGVFWNSQDYILEDIDRIEVISGPGGTLWGANAVNGVINISTKSAKDTVGTYLDAAVGTSLQNAVGARYGAKLAPNIYFRVYGKYLSHDDAVLPSGSDASDFWHQAQAGFRIDAEPSTQNTFTLQGDLYSGNEAIQSGDVAKIAGDNLLGRWVHTLAEDSVMTLQLYYDRTHLSDPFAASPYAPAGRLIDDLDTYDLDFQHRFHLGERQQIVWGLGYRYTHDHVKQQAPNFAFLPAILDQSLTNIFLQDELKLAETLFFTAGSKFEHNGYTGFEWEPNLRLKWNVSSKQVLWSAVSRAVRMPSRLDRELFEPAPPVTLIKGSPLFRSETVIAYEIGYRAQLNSSTSVSLSTYYNQYDHLRSLGLTPVTVLPLVYANELEGRSYGAELSVNYQVLEWWRLHAGYNLLKERIRVKPGKVDFQKALGETEDPMHQVSIRSSMDLPSSLALDTEFRWVDRLVTSNGGGVAGEVPRYSEVNIRLGWRPTAWLEWSVVGQNLLHKSHPEYGFPGPTREQIERGVYTKLALRF